jgi:hypothetical protein
MNRIWTALAALCLLLLIATDGARAINSPSGIDSRLRFEYEVGRTRQGQPEIQGYIYNDYGRAANNVRMIVETLDGSGQVVGRAYGYVFGIVPVFNRTPFNVPLQMAGASYRLTVTSFEWRDLGGGGS